MVLVSFTCSRRYRSVGSKANCFSATQVSNQLLITF